MADQETQNWHLGELGAGIQPQGGSSITTIDISK
jgi:hypothetical protein